MHFFVEKKSSFLHFFYTFFFEKNTFFAKFTDNRTFLTFSKKLAVLRCFFEGSKKNFFLSSFFAYIAFSSVFYCRNIVFFEIFFSFLKIGPFFGSYSVQPQKKCHHFFLGAIAF